MSRVSGFTLVELMIVIALVAIIAGFAMPQFGRVIDNNRAVSATNSIIGLLSFARSEAVRRGRQVRVSPVDGNSWNSGALAWVDTDGDGQVSIGETLRQTQAAEGSLNLTGGNVAFRGNGLTDSAAAVTYGICSGTGMGRQVVVSPGGRADVQEINCP